METIFVPKGFSVEKIIEEDNDGDEGYLGYTASDDTEDINMISTNLKQFGGFELELIEFFTVYLRAIKRRENKTPDEIKQLNDNIKNIKKLIECRDNVNEFKTVIDNMIKIYTNI